MEAAWDSTQGVRNPFKRVAMKLKKCARRLKSWSDRLIGNLKLQLLLASELILCLDIAMESRLLS